MMYMLAQFVSPPAIERVRLIVAMTGTMLADGVAQQNAPHARLRLDSKISHPEEGQVTVLAVS